jgi:hypothetical protein
LISEKIRCIFEREKAAFLSTFQKTVKLIRKEGKTFLVFSINHQRPVLPEIVQAARIIDPKSSAY